MQNINLKQDNSTDWEFIIWISIIILFVYYEIYMYFMHFSATT